MGVEILEQWQRLKVHGMSLERYLGSGKMELLKREVESSTGIPLKTMPRWLINEERLKEQQEVNHKRGLAIVITVSSESEAKRLAASGLRFGRAIKKVEKYWDAGPRSVCLRCCGIGHECQNSCGDRPEKCTMCAGAHQVSEHQYGVNGCSKKRGKLCVHVVARCANYQGNHQANSPQCPSRPKAEMQARKNKIAKNLEVSVKITVEQRVISEDRDEFEADTLNSNSDMGMDNEREKAAQELEEENLDLVMENDDWAASPASSLSLYEENKGLDSVDRWDKC